MSFNFPDAPAENQVFTDAASGAQYIYKNGVWMQQSAAQVKQTALASQNIVVNPGFVVSQENGVTVGTINGYHIADQWVVAQSGLSAFTCASGYSTGRYFGYQSNGTAEAAPATGAYRTLIQAIEGIRMLGTGWGTSEAIPLVLNFKAESEKGGTFSAVFQSNVAPYLSFAYDFVLQPVATAGGWKEFTVAIPAQTAGDWRLGSSDRGANLYFTHTAGTDHKAPAVGWNTGSFLAGPGLTLNSAVTGNTLYIADVQLLPDPYSTGAAPRFLVPDYAEELRACQRYWQKTISVIFYGYTPVAANQYMDFTYPGGGTKRSLPAISFTNTSNFGCNGPASLGGMLDHVRLSTLSTGNVNYSSNFDLTCNARM